MASGSRYATLDLRHGGHERFRLQFPHAKGVSRCETRLIQESWRRTWRQRRMTGTSRWARRRAGVGLSVKHAHIGRADGRGFTTVAGA